MKSMGKARGLRHNNALQRTRSAARAAEPQAVRRHLVSCPGAVRDHR